MVACTKLDIFLVRTCFLPCFVLLRENAELVSRTKNDFCAQFFLPYPLTDLCC